MLHIELQKAKYMQKKSNREAYINQRKTYHLEFDSVDISFYLSTYLFFAETYESNIVIQIVSICTIVSLNSLFFFSRNICKTL